MGHRHLEQVLCSMSSRSSGTFLPITCCARSIGLSSLANGGANSRHSIVMGRPSVDPELMIRMLAAKTIEDRSLKNR
jgi:hypothetical protein